VCGPVKGVGHDGNDTFINVGFNYPDKERFTIVVWDLSLDVRRDVIEACGEGEISRYKGSTQVEVWDMDHLVLKDQDYINQENAP
jgi:hypothetical protein